MSVYVLPTGTLVQFKVTDFKGPEDIIIAGMYGTVVKNPYPHMLGSMLDEDSVLLRIIEPNEWIQVLGRSKPDSYSKEWFDKVEEEPDEEDLAASVNMAQNAFSIFEEKNGYTGFIKIGKNIIPQEKYLREMNQILKNILEWKNDEKKYPQVDAALNRLRKILRRFKNHPLSSEAESLSEKLKNVNSTSHDIDKWVDGIENWVTRAESAEILKPQSGRTT